MGCGNANGIVGGKEELGGGEEWRSKKYSKVKDETRNLRTIKRVPLP